MSAVEEIFELFCSKRGISPSETVRGTMLDAIARLEIQKFINLVISHERLMNDHPNPPQLEAP